MTSCKARATTLRHARMATAIGCSPTVRAGSSWGGNSRGEGSPPMRPEIRADTKDGIGITIAVVREDLRMNARRENLERIHDPGAGPVEVRVSIGQENASRTHAPPLAPGQDSRKRVDLRHGSLEWEAARLDDDHVRIEACELRTRYRRRPLAGHRDERRAARDRDELRHPNATEHDGLEPLHREDARSRRRGGGAR